MMRAASSFEAPKPVCQKGFPPTGGKPYCGTRDGAGGPRSANVQIAPPTGGGGEAGRGAASGPDLAFRVDGMPPRKTLQAGRGAYVKNGEVRFFTREDTRAEAWQMLAEFRRQLPAEWRARGGPVKVRVELVYPLRSRERERLEAAGAVDTLLPHVERPDADNIVKSLLDSMTRAGVWLDDAQVHDLRVRKWRGMRPRWAVFVWFLPLPALPRRRRRGTEDGPGQGRLALGPQDATEEGGGAGGHDGASGLAGRVAGHAGGLGAGGLAVDGGAVPPEVCGPCKTEG